MCIHVIAMCTIVGGGIKDAPFSSRTFVLPIKTRTLALVHLVCGALAICALWLFVVCLILRPTGHEPALFWPMMLFVMCLTVFQAISWTPFAQSWLRMPITVV